MAIRYEDLRREFDSSKDQFWTELSSNSSKQTKDVLEKLKDYINANCIPSAQPAFTEQQVVDMVKKAFEEANGNKKQH